MRLLDWSAVVLAFAAVASVVYYHGFRCSDGYREAERIFLHAAGWLFATHVAFSRVRSIGLRAYLANHGPHAMLLVVLVGESIGALSGASPMEHLASIIGIGSSEHGRVVLHHALVVSFAGLVLSEAAVGATRGLPWRPPAPLMFALGYLVLIVIGACLLMLPEMVRAGQTMSPGTALFTAVSATCVTGLQVVDTATVLSARGQVVLMLLIALGGANVIAFASYFMLTFKRELDCGQRAAATEFLGVESLGDLRAAVHTTFRVSLTVELLGASALLMTDPRTGTVDGQTAVLDALFHAVSAFNNAGFSSVPGGLQHPHLVDAMAWHGTIGWLVVLGAVGIPALQALALSPRRGGRVDATVAWSGAAALTVVGVVAFLLTEDEGLLRGRTTDDGLARALFMSVTTRTAGFATVDLGAASSTTLGWMMAMMFVGAATGSTGGGIKTSTAWVLVRSVLPGRARVQWLTPALRQRAAFVAGSSAAVVAVGFGGLVYTESGASSALLFEQVSAFGTVGLSTGVTPTLSVPGRWIIGSTIIVGRVGPLALAQLFGRRLTPEASGGLAVG